MKTFLMTLFLILVAGFLVLDSGLYYAAGSTEPLDLLRAFMMALLAESAMVLFSGYCRKEKELFTKATLFLAACALFITTNYAAGLQVTKGLREAQAGVATNQKLAKLIAEQKEDKKAQLQEFGSGKQRLNYAKGVNKSDELFAMELALHKQSTMAPDQSEVAIFFVLRICLSLCLVYFPSRLVFKEANLQVHEGTPSRHPQRPPMSSIKNENKSPIKADKQRIEAEPLGPVVSEEIPVNFFGDTPVLLPNYSQLRNIKGWPSSKANLTLLTDHKKMEEGRQYLAAQEKNKGLVRWKEGKLEVYQEKKWKAVTKIKAEKLLMESKLFQIKCMKNT